MSIFESSKNQAGGPAIPAAWTSVGDPMPPVKTDMLSFQNVDLTYETRSGKISALDSLSISVAPGEFVSVLGPSGCGKSTLLKIAAGLLKPTGGTVMLDGHPVVGPHRDVGIVFQHPTLLPWKTVLENVLVPARALKLPLAVFRRSAEELLHLVGLKDFLHHYPYQLSGGMQQRVGIARGLVHNPKVLLMDEPFAALDAMTREFMMEELQRIWASTGKSVLFITHSIPEAVFLSDRVVTLSSRPGRVLESYRIDIPRPRSIDVMSTEAFGRDCTHLRNLFNHSHQQQG